MFIGTVQCEVELSKSHPAFEGFRFLLVEAEHEVEWEGAVVAVDTVDAQVGDMVVVALAPLGGQFSVPEDLPIDGAIVGVVGSITTPAEDGEEGESVPRSIMERPRVVAEVSRIEAASEDEEIPVELPSERDAADRDARRQRRRGRDTVRDRSRDRGGAEIRPTEDAERSIEAVEPRAASPARPEEPARRPQEGRAGAGRDREPGRDRDRDRDRNRRGARVPSAGKTWEEEETVAPVRESRREEPVAPEREKRAPVPDDLEIVWDSGDAGQGGAEAGSSIKRKRRRR